MVKNKTQTKVVLEHYTEDNFSLFGYELNSVMADIMLVQYVDMSEDGSSVLRNGLHVPVNHITKAWRIGKVVLAGPDCKYAKTGDYVCFPNDKGIPVSNIRIGGGEVVKNGIFLNEDRMFGICSQFAE